ncbi:hypothetical protein [Umezawaea sp. Da 62-37]|uniref:hypothetical protein n=1 Tax=Umezawaea sp. Da 62-37 TaxID=3075927 RepID=UPI0028F6F65E|nr:hypothetical protein [Umezawaea sp. Da 62-37]WNV89661.1 hypothetical protein RM788_15565 [Umezawaea sp. Da 62-37]
MKQRIALFGAIAGAVLVVTGCSSTPAATTATGSSAPTSAAATATKSDPVAWSGAFCEGVTPTLEGLVEVLKSAFQETPDQVAQKAAMLNYATKAGSAMTDTAKKLETLGAPTAQAEELHKELIKFFSENGTTLTKVKTDLATIDPAAPDFLTRSASLAKARTRANSRTRSRSSPTTPP